MDAEDARVKVNSMLRRAGLSEVPRPVVVCVAVLCALLVVFALVRFWPQGSSAGEFQTVASQQGAGQAVELTQASSQAASESAQALAADGGASAQGPVVDVAGAVRDPGVYELKADARVADAVEAAGGLSRSAARGSVNLAQKVQDGEQVYVPTRKEASSGAAAAPSGAFGASGGSGASQTGGGKVNLNTASSEELQTLSGIGPALAQRIIDYRENKGGFESVEGLKEVSGIGDVRFAELEGSVCV